MRDKLQLVTTSVALILLTSCALQPQRVIRSDSVDETIEVLREGLQNNGKRAQQRAADARKMAAAEVDATDRPTLERFDVAVNAIPIRDFLHSLVRDTARNMVVHPKISGSVSLELKDVSIFEVMDVIRDMYGYDYTLERNTFQVYPNVLRTEIFQVDYLNVARRGHSEIQVSAGTVGDNRGSGGRSGQGNNSYGGDSYNNSGGGGNNGGRSSGVVGTVVNTDGEADFWSELEATLGLLVLHQQGSQIVVTPQVGLIVVRARPDALHLVRQYLDDVEGTLHRQVIIEAKIVEVTLRDGFESGIDWHSFGDASGGTFAPTESSAGSEHSVAGQFASGVGEVFNPLGGAFTLSAAFGDFSGALRLLRSQGTVQVLSSPRIATVNNQKAVIKVGFDEFFVTDISTDTVTAGSAINTNNSPQLTPFFSGIALDVTPQISADGDVVLHIHPTVSEVREQLKRIGGEDIPLAASTIRESDSVVRARNGEIIVIGGLMQNSSRDDNSQVPLLGRLPVLGNLFRGVARESTKSELVILLKPTIVNDTTATAAVRRSLDHTERLRAELR